MTQTSAQPAPQASGPLMQQIGILNLRVNDMMTQLNTVIKMMMEETIALKTENAELKAKQEKVNPEKDTKAEKRNS